MKGILILAGLLIYMQVCGQSTEESTEEEKGGHRFSIMMANAHIPSATEVDGDKHILIIPTWGINYDYWFTEKWAVGLHTDFFLQQFKIEKHGTEQTVERSFPVAVSVAGLYKPVKPLTLLMGVGREFEKHEDFNLICFGAEYGFELPKNWELSLNLIYDSKIDAYDSWMFGLGVSKFLSK